ncbi:MAG: helix-turn-helix domain-containing protein [Acidimicrobiales bacterium]
MIKDEQDLLVKQMGGHLGAEKAVLRVPEAADLLGISRSHAYELIADGKLPAIRLGRRIIVPVDAIERLLATATTLSV